MGLPTDVMFGIFFRLECKDIVSCRGVCRAWYSFLSDPTFSINYTRYSSLRTLLVIQPGCYSDYFSLVHVAANGEFFRRSIKPKVPRSPKGLLTVSVSGSCNGLVLLQPRNYNRTHAIEHVYLCNLLLGGCVAVREFKSVNKLGHCVEYKLGLVPSTNKIKLLRIGFDDDGRVLLEAHILTFREDDKWRKVKDRLTLFFYFTRGTSFNGAYHWAAKDKTVGWICIFDFGEEKCGRIPKPPGLPPLSYELTLLNNHLCLVELASCYGDMTIWTMKEYGVAESWSKDILLRRWFPDTTLYSLLPFAILPNGDILFLKYDELGLFSFSSKTKQFTKVRFRDAYPIYALYATTYDPRFYALVEDVSGRKH